ncbi:hypothetical protein [Scytonema sp. PCC 10023]|uniref:hypothetical protein n=1 Tax=Scytonema sp. PCC 10023 TaxID=1680591 RepID=UPI0039C608BA
MNQDTDSINTQVVTLHTTSGVNQIRKALLTLRRASTNVWWTTTRLVNQLRKALLTLRLWIWAAVHRQDFRRFELTITPIVRFRLNYNRWSDEFCFLRLEILKPRLLYFVPWTAVEEFAKAEGIDLTCFEDDEIPF